ncbi:hypothetical protein VIS19158_19672 [Vibrio scophthalmi LMG 19158]|uniref:Uncharacterized protein n=1 Tax=Vibrio scophthalmi LMG 19158 TaxID=870967 RepID=F9RPJ2_9VIBR|nr:hypothetical protein VIS19158_19672 [Vibrio scophthalmi LMG 19158]
MRKRESEKARKRESEKARKRESEKARKRESEKARKRESEKARKRESEKARKRESEKAIIRVVWLSLRNQLKITKKSHLPRQQTAIPRRKKRRLKPPFILIPIGEGIDID